VPSSRPPSAGHPSDDDPVTQVAFRVVTTATTDDERLNEGIERILVVVAHPDDVDFGASGTVATWTDAGIDVTYCLCTDGQAGGFDLTTPRAEIAKIRREEQTNAAKVVGVTELRFLGGMDGELEANRQLVRDITAVIRDVRPQRVMIPSPERDWSRIGRSHPDHLAAGEAAIRAIYPAARNPFAFPDLLEQGLEPWTVRQTWVMAHREVNQYIDVTDVFDRKLAAILAHVSQHPDPAAIEPRMRGFLAANAQAAGWPDRLAEAFFATETG
jgi:LmbE family N-acetylglucosaminyl deacetylase